MADIVDKNPKTLVLVGSYTIGKERVFIKLAEHFGWKICVSKAKADIIKCCDFPAFEQFTTNLEESQLHVVPIGSLSWPKLLAYLENHPRYTAIVGIRPTGWTFEEGAKDEFAGPQPRAGKVTSLAVPYSEHSSFIELRDFVKATRPVMIVSTVGASKQLRDDMNKHFAEWLGFSSPH